MEKKSTDECPSSPLSTVDEIQRRLVRPSSIHSNSGGNIVSQIHANSTELQRNREAKRRPVTNKRLVDYLDPALLSAIRAKIGVRRERGGEIKLKETMEFEWPADELKVLTEGVRREKVTKSRGSESSVVDLGDDHDVINGVGEGDHGGEAGKEEEVFCTPFQSFEKTALKWLKR